MLAHPTVKDTKASSSKGNKFSLGRKLKDHLTGTTHEERTAERTRRAAAEREMYRQHRILRRAMFEAMRSGRPQLMGRDENRVRVFLEAPGHTFPGVTAVARLSPYLSEVNYDGSDGRRTGPRGRYLRPEGDMYGCGYGEYGCGKFAAEGGIGRWTRIVGMQGGVWRWDGGADDDAPYDGVDAWGDGGSRVLSVIGGEDDSGALGPQSPG